MYTKVKTRLKKLLPLKRYRHCLRTAAVAQKLALLYKAAPRDAYLAGLLHDCARDLSDRQLLAEAQKYKLKFTKVFADNPVLLHGRIAAAWLKHCFKINKPAVATAISNHILGRPQMSKLEKILFVADYVEEARAFPEAQKIRNIVFQKNNRHALDLAVVKKAQFMIRYARKKKWQLHRSLIKLASRKI